MFKEIRTPHALPERLLQRKNEELLFQMRFSYMAMTLVGVGVGWLLLLLGKSDLVPKNVLLIQATPWSLERRGRAKFD